MSRITQQQAAAVQQQIDERMKVLGQNDPVIQRLLGRLDIINNSDLYAAAEAPTAPATATSDGDEDGDSA